METSSSGCDDLSILECCGLFSAVKLSTKSLVLLQTSSPKLRERALQENVKYEFIKLGIAKEQSRKVQQC